MQHLSAKEKAEASHSSWNCVSVEPKDSQGFTTAKLEIVVTPALSCNRLARITPEILFIDVGAPKKQNRANIELLGFIAQLLGLKEQQVSLEPGKQASKGKVVKLTGIKWSKKELIWALERKVGQRHDAHFAADNIQEARNKSNKEAVARRKELDEFSSLREAASASAPIPESQVPNLLLGTAVKRPMPSRLTPAKRLMSKSGDPDAQAAPLSEPTSTDDKAAPAEGDAEGEDNDKDQDVNKDNAASEEKEGGAGEQLGGLLGYDSEASDDDDEDDEDSKLPPPSL